MKSGDGIDKTYFKQACPFCGMKYSEFKTGYTFKQVRDMLWSNSEDPKDWEYKRRSSVLGKWHEIKMGHWNEHIAGCSEKYKDELPF